MKSNIILHTEVFMDHLLKGNDIAKILNISRSKAYQLMQRGEIPTVKIGHSVRVEPKDLQNFILENKTGNAVVKEV